MISSHSCSELAANTRQSNVLPSGLPGEALKMETCTSASRASGSERPALARNHTRDPAAALDVTFSKTHIPRYPPSQGPRATLTPRRRQICGCGPGSVPRRRWWGRGGSTGAVQGTGGRWHRGLWSVPVVPVLGLNWHHDPPKLGSPHCENSSLRSHQDLGRCSFTLEEVFSCTRTSASLTSHKTS